MPDILTKADTPPALQALDGRPAVERELVEFFVHLCAMLSLPRSVGEIYGAIYASPQPLCFEDIQQRLGISKGSVSQGLRFLRDMGAVQVKYIPGDRRDHFAAEHSLRRLAEGFLRDRVQPHLDNGRRRIEAIEQQLDPEHPDYDHYVEAVRALRDWSNKANRLLPLLRQVIALPRLSGQG
jgi:DNA-binding transcriptional regulator GbsR (MarR family)